MTTYLLTWNPKRFQWDELADNITHVREVGSLLGRWSCGNTRRIEPGDRFFLMRLGEKTRGIVGSGVILSQPFSEAHWEDERAERGENSLFVEVSFEILRDAETEIFLATRQLGKNGQ